MSKLRICIISQEFPPETGRGGIATQSALKARGLAARGHDITVLSVTHDEPRTYDYHGAKVHRMLFPAMPVPSFDVSSHWLTYSYGVAAWLNEFKQEQPFDIIHFPEYAGEGFIWLTDTFEHTKMKYAVQMHGPLAMLAEHTGWPSGTAYQVGTFMERMSVNCCHLLMASSHNTASYCAKHYGIDVDKVQVIHSGVDTDRFKPAPKPEGPGQPRILFIGKIVHAKGAETLIHSVLRLRKQFPDIILRLIGREDEKLAANLRQDIAEAGAQDNIELLGQVPHSELHEHLAWCDFFAGPSVFEPGPGNVYLEAMSSGRPVIACNTGGTPEVVTHEQTGLLIPPSDIESLCDAISRLAMDPTLCSKLGANGRERVSESFSESRYLDKVESAYKSMLMH
ncbi:MAG: glycosyltransferase family 4 protein [Phycisphaeraceae bacterium]